MHNALFHYPAQALFGRVLPKNKIYQHAAPSPAVKALFVQQIEKITWQYKLAPETLNLPAKSGITEIQIFDIVLKEAICNTAILRCIDNAIPFPIIYQLYHNDRVQVIATYKHATEPARYFSTDWLPSHTERQALPLALDLHSLYQQLLQSLLPTPARSHESLPEQIERLLELQQKQTDYRKLEARLHKEKQFNRKVELNEQLRLLKIAIVKLEQ